MGLHRMFSVRITGSTRFIKMPVSSQNLYFHLGMKADDDGVVEAYPVMCMIGATEDDLRILVGKQFVTVLNEDLVTFINDWTENNTIRPDRKRDSIYQDLLIKVVPDVNLQESKQRADRQVKNKIIDMDVIGTSHRQPTDSISKEKISKEKISKENIDYQRIADMYNATCVSFPRLTKLSDKRKEAIKARSKMYTLEDFKKLFEMAESSNFLKGENNKNWSATFDWMITDGNMAKILDGNYSNRSSQRQHNYTYNNSGNHSQSYENSRTDNNRMNNLAFGAVDSSEEKETVTLKPPVWKEPKYRIPLEEADINTEEGREVIKDAYKKFLTKNYPGVPYTEKDMVNWWKMNQLGYEITPTGEE